MNPPQLDELERRAYRTLVDDGLLDTLLGVCLLSFGLSDYAPFDGVPALTFLACVAAWTGLRHSLIEPRVGHVRLSPDRRSRIKRGRKAMMFLAGSLILGTALLAITQAGFREQLRGMGPLIVAAIFACTLAFGAFALEIRRLAAYAALVLLGGIWQVRDPAFEGGGWIVSGGLITVIGLSILMTFLRNHPTNPDPLSGPPAGAQPDA